MRTGVKEYLTNELPKEISPGFIAGMRIEVQEMMKNKIRQEFDDIREDIKGEMIDEMKEEIKD